MKVINFSATEANVNLSKNDLLVIYAALNEICNGIDLFEFETRIGANQDYVLKLFNLIGKLLDEIEN